MNKNIKNNRPNILMIMADQLRFDCLSSNGNRIIKTPNLEKLAKESADMQNCYIQSPVCVPSRQTYFLGRYPHSHKNRVNYTPLNDNEILMQSKLSDAGYSTAFVGKLHYWPPTREFAISTGFKSGLIHDAADTNKYSDYYCWLKEVAPEYTPDFRKYKPSSEGNPYSCILPEKYHETTWCGEQTRRELEILAEDGAPFFLFSSYWRPHAPFDIPSPWDNMYNDIEIPLPHEINDKIIDTFPLPVQKLIYREPVPAHKISKERLQWMYRSYYAAVSQIDYQVGLTLSTLESLGLQENTIVVFVSDHGDLLGEHAIIGKNAFYESAIHVPMLIKYPEKIEPGSYSDLIESTDFLSTLFELCSLEVPSNNEGKSFAQLITKNKIGSDYKPRDFVFAENIIPEVINDKTFDFPYIKGKGVGGIIHPDAKMVRDKHWKYVRYVDNGEELFNIVEDPMEMKNLATDSNYKEIKNTLKDALLDWLITSDESSQIAPRWCLD